MKRGIKKMIKLNLAKAMPEFENKFKSFRQIQTLARRCLKWYQ